MIIDWLFSSDSSGVLTLATGLIAWLVYSHQIRLREKEAAIVLINEIHQIEAANKFILTRIQENKFDPHSELLNIAPTCSWDQNYQIFTRYLSRKDFDTLNSFFASAKAAQKHLEQIKDLLEESQLEKARLIQSVFFQASLKATGDFEAYKDAAKYGDFFLKESRHFGADQRSNSLKNVLSNMPNISEKMFIKQLEAIANR